MNPDDVRNRMRPQILAFIGILALALIAAGAVLTGNANPSAVLAIAAVQVVIVLAAMMHAHRDGPWVRWLIAFCAFFVAMLAGMTYLGYHDTIDGTEHVTHSSHEHETESGEAEH